MNSSSTGPAQISAVKLALLAEQLAGQESVRLLRAEPIAVVGLGCRFPGGGDDPEKFWDLLEAGVDAIRPVPPERWDIERYFDPDPAAPGKMNTRWGGFLERVDGFDPAFFGISPREAVHMDPQQRLLLEVAQEALEDAGQTRERLNGSRTGVFIACYGSDYSFLQAGRPGSIEAYTSTGTAHSIVANRLSFLLNLQGPSLVVDTACSSSLVALHLACQSLRQRECSLALAGGVSLILSPEMTLSLSKWGFMAPDGRCKTFDAAANGFVRSEGCGVVALKRLPDALAAGDRILALIRGSAVNQDGRSTVMTAPNGLAQAAVIRQALEAARVDPSQMSYIEAHGTGTALGDPIEVEALAEVFGGPRPDGSRCVLASVKTNLGHLEAAAGIAGVIKVVLSLQKGKIPAHLHFRSLNPHISLAGTPFTIPTRAVDWPAGEKPRLAGVSSFGFGGTNAHVVIEEAPALPRAERAAPPERLWLLPLSARSEEALGGAARAYRDFLARGAAGASIADLAYTAALRRDHHEHRLAACGRSLDELAEQLDLYLQEGAAPRLRAGQRASAAGPQPVFVFSGQGSQWAGMGLGLLEAEPVFRESFQRCSDLLQAHCGWSLQEELSAPGEISRLEQTEVAQPAIFALQISLAALWRSWGIQPAAVVGHSLGEIAAACAAGALTLEEAVRLVYERGRLMQQVTGLGRMASVELPEAEAARWIAPYGARLSVAAVNSPRDTVLSGESAALHSLIESLQQAGVRCKDLGVNYAFHSAQVAPLAEQLSRLLADLRPREAQLPFISTVTGERLQGQGLDAAYWEANMRRPVRFARAVESLGLEEGGLFLELGPHPVLASMLARCQEEAVVLPSLQRGKPERERLLLSLGELWARGCSPAWEQLFPEGGQVVTLPPYPWQRRRCWLDGLPPRAGEAGPGAANTAGSPLLGEKISSPVLSGRLYQASLSCTQPAFLGDHRIYRRAILPAAALYCAALDAARPALGEGPLALQNVLIEAALALPETGQTPVQLHFEPQEPGAGAFRLFFEEEGERWRQYARGRAVRLEQEAQGAPALEQVRAQAGRETSPERFYAGLSGRGIEFGPAFQGIEALWRGEGQALARLRLPVSLQGEAGRYAFHPALLDAALQPALAAAGDDSGAGEAYLPVSLDELRLHRRPGPLLWSQARLAQTASPGETRVVDLTIWDEQGQVVAELEGLVLKRAAAGALAGPASGAYSGAAGGDLYTLEWQPAPRTLPAAVPARPGNWLLLADEGGVAESLAEALRARGGRCLLAYPGPRYEQAAAEAWRLDPQQPEHFKRLLAAAREQGPLEGALYLWALDLPPLEAAERSPAQGQAAALAGALHLVQALGSLQEARPPRLWLATRAAQPADAAAPPAVEQAPLWGLAAVLELEHPELRPTCIDLDPYLPAPESGRLLFEELWQPEGESRLALRGGERLAPRLARQAPAGQAADLRLWIEEPGLMDRLALKSLSPQAPGPGEVEIQVRAGGLNFRDVLKSLGRYPGEPNPLGDECAGVVRALGPGVSGLRVGERVLALAPGSHGTAVVAPAALVLPIPQNLSFEEAAGFPIAFLTAYYGLYTLAGLQPGERVLIHAAAGGVGLAAVQLAQRRGAEIFATAGSERKRRYLQELGVQHVFDSRALDFAPRILALTGGEGVHLVLNSLAGDFIPRSLEVLAPGGRFVELGKTGIWEESRALAHRPGIRYFTVYLGDQFRQEQPLVRSMLCELLALLEAGELQPLPLRVFPLEAAAAAYRFMAQARHIGKLVLVPATAPREPNPGFPERLRAGASYLITGGLGGLGLSLVRWMAARGAGCLVLAGRGEPSPQAQETVRELEAGGTRVVVARVDVADYEALAGLLERIRRELPPLRGVAHAAGVNRDGVLGGQSWERFLEALSPKLDGAWNLHRLTEGLPLDFMLYYSSIASVFGWAGQGNYAAANAFLDALAHSRRSQGLPALSINWGAWEGPGMSARLSARDRERQAQYGLRPFTPEQGLEALAGALSGHQPQVVYVPLDWAAFRAAPGGGRSLFARQETGAPAAERLAPQEERPRPEFLRRWEAAAPGQRPNLLLAFLKQEAARAIGLPPDQAIDPRQPLHELGLDSLMALEMRNSLSRALDLRLPATLLFDYPTCQALVAFLQREALAPGGESGAAGESEPPEGKSPAAGDEAALDELTDEEAQNLLLAELEALKKRK